MLAIRAAAAKPNPRRKAVDRRRKELKGIRERLSKMAQEERTRVSSLWEEHKTFFKNEDEEPKVVDVEIVQEESIDNFFNGDEK